MFLGNPDRKGGAGAFIGYDISDRYAQISFWLPGADKPETLSQVMGEEEYMIPAAAAGIGMCGPMEGKH